jgi:beta-N-acetylhexosaminidase
MLGRDLGLDALERMHRALVERVPEERLAEAAGRVEAAPLDGSHGQADPDVGLEAARRALHAEGDPRVAETALIVELVPEPLIAAGPARHGLGGLEVRDGDAVPDVAGRELVLVVRDPHRHAWQRAVAEGLVRSAARTVLLDTGIPGWRPQAAAGYLATYGGGRVNLEAAIELLYGSP